MVKRVPKHLLNTTEVTTRRNGVKTYHGKMLNGVTSYSGHILYIIFLEEPLFFIIQDCVHERRHYFVLRSLVAIIFICLINFQGSTLVTPVMSRQNQFVNKHF